jgi:nicotinamide-nucleotide amidase
VNIELINTGSELMLGRVLNTHQQWLCRQLADHGYVVSRQVAISDSAGDIQAAVREALGRADLVITTGGLGPTSDDLTRDRVAALLGRSLHTDADTLVRLEEFYRQRKRRMPDRVRVQAQVPTGAIILPNQHGTAPGLALEVEAGRFRSGGRSWLILLPGPPRELHPMFSNQVVPLLRERLPLDQPYACLNLRTTGIPESRLEEAISGPLERFVAQGLDLGYCARVGEVDVRLAAHGTSAGALIAEAEAVLRRLLPEAIYGTGDVRLEDVVVRQLTEQKQTVIVAESCTGGLIAHRLTNVPGASAVFLGGFVTYANALKQSLLGVRDETLAAHGAVSEETAREMATGARASCGADYAVSVTGIAGPSGGTESKPVGTVFLGLASVRGVEVTKCFNPFDRETFKQVTSQQALDALRRAILAG